MPQAHLQDWGKSDLADYLREASWHPHRAMYLLSGYMVANDTLPDDFEDVTVLQAKNSSRLSTWWRNESHRHFYNDPRPPSHYIDWALSKQFVPDWLEWAIGKNLCSPKHQIPNIKHAAPSPTKESTSAEEPQTNTTSPPENAGKKSSHSGTIYPPLESVTKPHLSTAEAAYYLNRSPQTLRGWASREDGLLRPTRINGKLAWSVADIQNILIR